MVEITKESLTLKKNSLYWWNLSYSLADEKSLFGKCWSNTRHHRLFHPQFFWQFSVGRVRSRIFHMALSGCSQRCWCKNDFLNKKFPLPTDRSFHILKLLNPMGSYGLEYFLNTRYQLNYLAKFVTPGSVKSSQNIQNSSKKKETFNSTV